MAAQKLAGAKHIVQRQPIQNLVNTSPQPRVPPPGDRTCVPLALVPGGAQRLQREAAAAAAAEVEAARAFDELPYMYAMEFMKLGDAHSLLVKGATQGVKWKSEELWMVFECCGFLPSAFLTQYFTCGCLTVLPIIRFLSVERHHRHDLPRNLGASWVFTSFKSKYPAARRSRAAECPHRSRAGLGSL